MISGIQPRRGLPCDPPPRPPFRRLPPVREPRRRTNGLSQKLAFAVAAKQIGREVITGRTKTGKSRVVSLGQNAVGELRAWRATQAEQMLALGVRQNGDTLVCTRADGSRIRPNAITIDFWRLAKRLGLNVHYHSLRHGHATALLIAGVHPRSRRKG